MLRCKKCGRGVDPWPLRHPLCSPAGWALCITTDESRWDVIMPEEYNSDDLDRVVVERDRVTAAEKADARAVVTFLTGDDAQWDKTNERLEREAAADMEDYPPGFFEQYDKDEEA